MATAKQLAWRRTFAARYGGKKKASKARKATRSPTKVTITARRRRSSGRRKAPRSVYRAARRRVYHKHEFILPAADFATGISFADGAMGPGKRASGTLLNFGLGAVGAKGYSINNGIEHAKIGVTQFASDPGNRLIDGVKSAAPVLVYRWIAKKAGVPKSVRVFKGFRIQVR